jgi:hypothetical protein
MMTVGLPQRPKVSISNDRTSIIQERFQEELGILRYCVVVVGFATEARAVCREGNNTPSHVSRQRLQHNASYSQAQLIHCDLSPYGT